MMSTHPAEQNTHQSGGEDTAELKKENSNLKQENSKLKQKLNDHEDRLRDSAVTIVELDSFLITTGDMVSEFRNLKQNITAAVFNNKLEVFNKCTPAEQWLHTNFGNLHRRRATLYRLIHDGVLAKRKPPRQDQYKDALAYFKGIISPNLHWEAQLDLHIRFLRAYASAEKLVLLQRFTRDIYRFELAPEGKTLTDSVECVDAEGSGTGPEVVLFTMFGALLVVDDGKNVTLTKAEVVSRPSSINA